MKKIFLCMIIATILILPIKKVDAESSESLIQYYSHVQDYGWLKKVSDGEITGTVGKSKRIEAFVIEKNIEDISGDIYYRSYVEGEG